MASKYDKYITQILELHDENLSNADIGRTLGIDSRRVSEILRKRGMSGHGKTFKGSPTPLQHEHFVANAIGDGSIFKSKENINYRMNLAHSLEQKDYFIMKYEAVKDFINVDYTLESRFDKRTKKTYSYLKYQTRVHPYFTELHDQWYQNGSPIIRDENADQLTARVLSYLYFDDGNKTNYGMSIAVRNYDLNSIKNIIERMSEVFGVEANWQKSGNIYIPAKHAQRFADGVRPYATNDVLYKLGEFSGTPNV